MPNEPYAGATTEQLSSPMVQEFLNIHNMFRNQLQAMLNFIDDLMVGDAALDSPEAKARVQMLIRGGSQYTQLLHFHHHGETSALFPALQRDGLETEVVNRLNADHDEIGVMVAASTMPSTISPLSSRT